MYSIGGGPKKKEVHLSASIDLPLSPVSFWPYMDYTVSVANLKHQIPIFQAQCIMPKNVFKLNVGLVKQVAHFYVWWTVWILPSLLVSFYDF